MHRGVTRLTLAGVAVGLVACGPADDPSSRERDGSGIVIDESAGSVGGARLGDAADEVERTLGPPRPGRDQRPTSEAGLPWIITPPASRRRDKRVQTLSFDDLYVLVAPGAGAYAIAVWRDGARTTSGIALGDPLDEVSRRHPQFDCGVRNRGTAYAEYPFCRGRIGGHWVWFGQDPIRSITLTTTRPG